MNIFKAIAEKFSIPLPWGVFKNSAFTNYALDYEVFLKNEPVQENFVKNKEKIH